MVCRFMFEPKPMFLTKPSSTQEYSFITYRFDLWNMNLVFASILLKEIVTILSIQFISASSPDIF